MIYRFAGTIKKKIRESMLEYKQSRILIYQGVVMDKSTAKRILEQIIQQDKEQQQVIVTHLHSSEPPYNGMSDKTAKFIDSLQCNDKMKQVVDELSDNVANLIPSMSKKRYVYVIQS